MSISEEKPKLADTSSKIAAMKAGYSAFVKKGTSTTANVFKPSVTSQMTEEPDLFDHILRETSDKQKVGVPSESVEMIEVKEEVIPEVEQLIIGPTAPLIPLVPPPPPPEDDTDVPALQNGTPLASWDTPGPSPTILSHSNLAVLKELPADRTSAILEKERSDSLSEGECSDSEDEKMES